MPVFSKCHHCAQEGIHWVHSCKCSLRGTNRLLKTKLRSRNLSACHLYYLLCSVCLHTVHRQRMEALPGSCASQRTLSPEILSCLVVCSRFSVSEQQAWVASLSCGLLCAHQGADGERHTCLGQMLTRRVGWNQWEEQDFPGLLVSGLQNPFESKEGEIEVDRVGLGEVFSTFDPQIVLFSWVEYKARVSQSSHFTSAVQSTGEAVSETDRLSLAKWTVTSHFSEARWDELRLWTMWPVADWVPLS